MMIPEKNISFLAISIVFVLLCQPFPISEMPTSRTEPYTILDASLFVRHALNGTDNYTHTPRGRAATIGVPAEI